MRTIEKTIYNFDELSEEVQNKLIEEQKASEYECYMNFSFHDDMLDKASELVSDYFNINSEYIKTYYSLSYSQGDGAIIEFNIDIKDLNNKYKIFTDDEIEFFKQKDVINNIYIRHNNSHYYHEYTFMVNHEFYNDLEFEDIKDYFDITEEDFNTLWDRFYELVNDDNKHYTNSEFIKDTINMNKELTRYGYDIIENYEYDVNYIIEQLRENEYYENGEVYYGD